MPRVCQQSGKRTRFGKKISRRGLSKKVGGIGIKTTGITRRTFKPNLQKIRVLLPNGTVKRMRLATSVIRNGWIEIKVDGKMKRVPLVKAARGRNRKFEEPVPKVEAQAEEPAEVEAPAAETEVAEAAAPEDEASE